MVAAQQKIVTLLCFFTCISHAMDSQEMYAIDATLLQRISAAFNLLERLSNPEEQTAECVVNFLALVRAIPDRIQFYGVPTVQHKKNYHVIITDNECDEIEDKFLECKRWALFLLTPQQSLFPEKESESSESNAPFKAAKELAAALYPSKASCDTDEGSDIDDDLFGEIF